MLRLCHLLRGRQNVARAHIIFDFVRGNAYRADSASMADTLAAKTSKVTRPRVVKTVIGVPPSVVLAPTPKK